MSLAVPTERTALLLVDVQNAFLDPGGLVARMAGGVLESTYTDTIEPTATLIAAARSAGVPIIYTQHAYQPDYSDAGFIGTEIFARRFADAAVPDEAKSLSTGSWEADIFPALAPEPGDIMLPKNRFDAFLGTPLEQHLTRLGIDTIVVAGLVTTICVESTIRDAAMRDYRVHAVTDAIGDASAVHADGLARITETFALPTTSAEVAQAWAPAAVPA
ncbi:MAG: isochorismatase family cysteine hydrolase [Solirubrobacteraceae bacterium]|nr:isochorismatase family cysteine hydrolase [Patulibacter sp.]